MLNNLDGTFDTEEPCCSLYNVTQAPRAPAVVLADLTDADARLRPVERQRKR
jgi:hypothetical protein